MAFRRFMEISLYDPEVGYYTRAAAGPGPGGDYVTSPELHAAFGALLCAQLEAMWRSLGRPDPFWLVEGGPGTGAFVADVLAVAAEAFFPFARALRVALIERVPALRECQRAALGDWAGSALWLEAGPEAWPRLGPGCVFANELLDALPVHRVVMRQEGLRECFVAVRDGRFTEVEEAPSTPLLALQVEAGGGTLSVGCYGEVNRDAPAWIQTGPGLIERGYALLIDYGEWANRLYGLARPRGTLRCYRHQVLLEDPLACAGQRDITAHVDFSAVARAARQAGLELLGTASQAAFLERLGLQVLREAVRERVPDRVEQRAHEAALRLLADERGLGGLTVLLFGKGASAADPGGMVRGRRLQPPDVPSVWRLRGDPLRLLASMNAL